jgi:hypothetical protein
LPDLFELQGQSHIFLQAPFDIGNLFDFCLELAARRQWHIQQFKDRAGGIQGHNPDTGDEKKRCRAAGHKSFDAQARRQ